MLLWFLMSEEVSFSLSQPWAPFKFVFGGGGFFFFFLQFLKDSFE